LRISQSRARGALETGLVVLGPELGQQLLYECDAGNK
jgi:hypothetical protein